MEPTCACGRPLLSQSDFKHQCCFRCKVRGITFDFSGVQDRLYGEGLTHRQAADRQVEEARNMGIEPEPVGARWV